jgi:ParB-like chromosome segregation protein Spo0J
MSLVEQIQEYLENKYSVTDLIEISKDLPVENVDIRIISGNYNVLDKEYDIHKIVDYINECKSVDLKYPILLYRGVIMDGKHRFTKALLEGKKTIKAKILTELPPTIN